MRYLLACILVMGLMSCGSGDDGINGAPGADGTSCYTETRDDGNYVVCGDSEFEVADGKDGTNGTDGQDGQDGSFDGYLEYVTVCEDIPGSYQEVLVELDGKFLAFLDDGRNDRLVVLEENITYRTTDGRNVRFQIINGSIMCPAPQ